MKPKQQEHTTVAGATHGKRGKKQTTGRAAAAAAKAARKVQDARGAGLHTHVEELPWHDPDLRKTGYVHKDFSAARDAFDGAVAGAADIRLSKAVPMRVPIVLDKIERQLVDASGQSQRHVGLQDVLVVCSLHAAMRTCESLLNLMTAVRTCPASCCSKR